MPLLCISRLSRIRQSSLRGEWPAGELQRRTQGCVARHFAEWQMSFPPRRTALDQIGRERVSRLGWECGRAPSHVRIEPFAHVLHSQISFLAATPRQLRPLHVPVFSMLGRLCWLISSHVPPVSMLGLDGIGPMCKCSKHDSQVGPHAIGYFGWCIGATGNMLRQPHHYYLLFCDDIGVCCRRPPPSPYGSGPATFTWRRGRVPRKCRPCAARMPLPRRAARAPIACCSSAAPVPTLCRLCAAHVPPMCR